MWPPQDEEIWRALERAWQSGDWGRYHGQHVEALERQLAERHEVALAMTCASGTFAVELALRAAGVQPGDEVLLAGYDFPGNFRSIEAIGARPVLVDIEPATWCLDVEAVEQHFEKQPLPRAVIVSHLHGGLADMQRLCAWARPRRVAVIEDACQTPGAMVQGRRAGAWGDVGVLSFGGSKLLTAGRGGAILMSDPSLYQRARIFCDRGNHAFPLSELQAAVLLPQLDQLDARNHRRQQSVQLLTDALAEHTWLVPAGSAGRGQSSYYKLAWRLDGGDPQLRDRLLMRAEQQAWPLGAGFRGFARRGPARCRRVGDLTHSIAAAERTLLLHHPILLAAREQLSTFAQQFHEELCQLRAGT